MDKFIIKPREYVLRLLLTAARTLYIIQSQKLVSVRDRRHLIRAKNVLAADFPIFGLIKKKLAKCALRDLRMITMQICVLT